MNIGGLGTLIASMASLISYKYFAQIPNVGKGKYLLWFTLANLLFAIVLLGACSFAPLLTAKGDFIAFYHSLLCPKSIPKGKSYAKIKNIKSLNERGASHAETKAGF